MGAPQVRPPFFAELADRIQERAHRRGRTLRIDQTGGTRERELLVREVYRSPLVDGVIFSPHSLSIDDLLEHDVEAPIVLLGEKIETSTFVHVGIDMVASRGTPAASTPSSASGN